LRYQSHDFLSSAQQAVKEFAPIENSASPCEFILGPVKGCQLQTGADLKQAVTN
jgi:hypothetical protein